MIFQEADNKDKNIFPYNYTLFNMKYIGLWRV